MIIAINLMIIGFWLMTSGDAINPILPGIGCVVYSVSALVATIIWDEHKRRGGNEK